MVSWRVHTECSRRVVDVDQLISAVHQASTALQSVEEEEKRIKEQHSCNFAGTVTFQYL